MNTNDDPDMLLDLKMAKLSMMSPKDLADEIDKMIKEEQWIGVAMASCQMVKRYAAIQMMAGQKLLDIIKQHTKKEGEGDA